MPRQAIGNTNVGIYSPLSILIDTTAPYTLDNVRTFTYPTQNQSGANVGDYAQASGQYLFQIKIRTNNQGKGTAKFTSPYTTTTTTTNVYIGENVQVYSYTYGSISIEANQIYPGVFTGWFRDSDDVRITTAATYTIGFNDALITGNDSLTAKFV